jgi:hypothetical protein
VEIHSRDENDFGVFFELLDRYRTGSIGRTSGRVWVHQEKRDSLVGSGGYLHHFAEVFEFLHEFGDIVLVGPSRRIPSFIWESKPELPKIGKLLLATMEGGAEWPSRSQDHFHPSSNPVTIFAVTMHP